MGQTWEHSSLAMGCPAPAGAHNTVVILENDLSRPLILIPLLVFLTPITQLISSSVMHSSLCVIAAYSSLFIHISCLKPVIQGSFATNILPAIPPAPPQTAYLVKSKLSN
ncbi:uncharacterized [Tachysurus ichikawai]